MKQLFNSIKSRIFTWYFLSSIILLFAIITGIYLKVENVLISSVDETLHSKMQVLLGLLDEDDNKVELELSKNISGEYSIPRSGHYFKIIINKRDIHFSPSLVTEGFNFKPGKKVSRGEADNETVFQSKGPDREKVRVLHKIAEIFDTPVEIFIAESMENTDKMLKSFYWFLILLIPGYITVVALVARIIATRSLKPIDVFTGEVDRISHLNLDKRISGSDQVKELSGLAISFNNLLDRLNKAFNLEKYIVLEASHQLKTPVAVIKSNCDILLQRERKPAQYIESLTTIREVSDNMTKLINDMLVLARLESGSLQLNNFLPVCLNECIEDAVSLVKHQADKKNIEIIVEQPESLFITGDKDKLTEAVVNIIDNAVRYNRENGLVSVQVSKQADTAVLLIKDNGPGINENDLSHIFEKFYRSEETSAIEGTGLGLSISKSVIQLHKGNISVESEPGKGTCFKITLPIPEAEIVKPKTVSNSISR